MRDAIKADRTETWRNSFRAILDWATKYTVQDFVLLIARVDCALNVVCGKQSAGSCDIVEPAFSGDRNGSAQRRRVIWPIESDHDWDTYTQDQLALMTHLGFERFAVAGMCIGGPYIMNLLKLAPQRVVASAVMQTIGGTITVRNF